MHGQGSGNSWSGSSGGGSINIFYNIYEGGENASYIVTGGVSTTGGNGGNGCVTKGKIIEKTFVSE